MVLCVCVFLIFWRYPLKHLYMKSFEIWFKRSICRENGDGKYMKYQVRSDQSLSCVRLLVTP